MASGLPSRVRAWATSAPRRAVLVVAGVVAGAWVLWALVVTRVALNEDDEPPVPALATVGVLAVVFAVERAVAFRRAFRRPCRRPVEGSSAWVSGPLVIACAIGFGILGLVDGDPSTPVGIAAVMLAAGLVAASSLAAWFRKPVCPEDDQSRGENDESSDRTLG